MHHSVPIRYTPLIQAERLADPDSPQAIVVGAFTDARATRDLGKVKSGIYKWELDLVGNLEETVRGAFVDGLLKSGFIVPMPGADPGQPIFTMTGEITQYFTDDKGGWSEVSVAAHVGVDLALRDANGPEAKLSCEGHSETKGKSIPASARSDLLDQALGDCVKGFLADDSFRALLSGPGQPEAPDL
jgi:hypothetical protein